MPAIKLTYFDFPFWRAEVSRLALHLGNVPFEDIRNKTQEERDAFKESGKSPFGQLPILEVDGKVIAQTGAIARYCGKVSGFYPKDDDIAAAKIDEIIDTATDITMHIGKTLRMVDVNEKLEARKQLAEDTFPMYLKALEKIMTQNGSTGFYVGSKMTIADIAMWRLFGWMTGGNLDGVPISILEPYPQLMANMKAIGAKPKISAWMAKHYAKPVIKLYYGDAPVWRAEVSRLALHLGNVSFEDVRAKTPEEKAAFKESGKAPFGQIPILEVDGKIIAQTGAIARYCGKLGGFYPKDDDFAAAKIDEIIDTATDITVHISKTMRMAETEKLEARKQLAKDTFPMYFKALEKIMTQNGSTGFYVGSKMTIADLAIWAFFRNMRNGKLDGIPTNTLDRYPQLLANVKAMETNPKIAAWMSSHYS